MRFFLYIVPLSIYVIILAVSGHICFDQTLVVQEGGDKVVHFIAYAVLAFLVFRALFAYGKFHQYRLWGFAAVLFYGIVDEVWQSFIPCRCASYADFIADFIGAFFVFVISSTVIYKKAE